ncbi:hypothetical protein DID76_04560 [Candidatus Marinamargulisbacteria bacterium SCGC AG-414-C22]|nr:hypothetical protein DID76_04560 [Candidatus Marinamargulisbacteria bacterium SCGC AG-414-C22]
MNISFKEDNNNLIAIVAGRIDTLTSNEFEQALLPKITASMNTITIDLAAVDYISSTGLRVFIVAQKKAMSFHKSLLIKHAQETVYDVFSVSGLVPLFEFE